MATHKLDGHCPLHDVAEGGKLMDHDADTQAEKLFNDRPLDGPTVATLLPVLADKLNSDEELLPREVWRLMVSAGGALLDS